MICRRTWRVITSKSAVPGRDGLQADCLLLFSTKDLRTIKFFINEQGPRPASGGESTVASDVVILRNQSLPAQADSFLLWRKRIQKASCEMCDNCQTAVQEEDLVELTIPAQKFLSCVKRTGQIFGSTHIIDVLRGSRSQRCSRVNMIVCLLMISAVSFLEGSGSFLARQFIQQDLLTQDMEHGSLKLTPKAYDVFKGQDKSLACRRKSRAFLRRRRLAEVFL